MKSTLGPIKIASNVLTLLGIVSRETTMLPGSGKVFEFVGRDLVVGSVWRLLFIVAELAFLSE